MKKADVQIEHRLFYYGISKVNALNIH